MNLCKLLFFFYFQQFYWLLQTVHCAISYHSFITILQLPFTYLDRNKIHDLLTKVQPMHLLIVAGTLQMCHLHILFIMQDICKAVFNLLFKRQESVILLPVYLVLIDNVAVDVVVQVLQLTYQLGSFLRQLLSLHPHLTELNLSRE